MSRIAFLAALFTVICSAPNAFAQGGSYPAFAQTWDVTVEGTSDTHGLALTGTSFDGTIRLFAGPNGALAAYTWGPWGWRWAAGAWKSQRVYGTMVVTTSMRGSFGDEISAWGLEGDESTQQFVQPAGDRVLNFTVPEPPVPLPREMNIVVEPRLPQAQPEHRIGTWQLATADPDRPAYWVVAEDGTLTVTTHDPETGVAIHSDGTWENTGARDNMLRTATGLYDVSSMLNRPVIDHFLSDDFIITTIHGQRSLWARAPDAYWPELPEGVRTLMEADARWQACDVSDVTQVSVRAFDLDHDNIPEVRTRSMCRGSDEGDVFNLWKQTEDGGYTETAEFIGTMLIATAGESTMQDLVGLRCQEDSCNATRFVWADGKHEPLP